METRSYWLEEPCAKLPLRRFDGAAEVAVIGGGVTGCSCALTLAERGVRVRLYEAREIAGGARDETAVSRCAAPPCHTTRRDAASGTSRRAR